MRALLQRVTRSSVRVAGQEVAAIERGLLVLLGVQGGDDAQLVERMAQRILDYRVFADADGRMNRSLSEVGGGLLLVPQFTLAADTDRGLRPGFSGAAEPVVARALYDQMCRYLAPRCRSFGCGQFGADMQVALINDGPVTFLLELAPGAARKP